jgi:hypothetical protein
MYSRNIPESEDANPSVTASETPHSVAAETKSAVAPTPATEKESPEGPPKTVWGTIAFACTIISGAYCWAFTAWDKSEFPEETLQNPWFWWGLALLLGLAIVYALFVRTSHLLDRVLISALCVAVTGSAIQGHRVSREIRPSERQFTIAVFGFTGDGDALTNDMARRIRGTILDQLRTRFDTVPHQPLILSRDRNPKGETPQEEAESIRKWAKRGRGAHLALWLRVHLKSGNQYAATARYMRVSPWGTEHHKTDILVTAESEEEIAFTAPPGGNVPADQAQRILKDVEFLWGLAAFQRDDFQTALSVLPPLNTGLSEFYSGETMLEESRASDTPARIRQQGMDHFAKAIQIEPEEVRKVFYFGELSDELVSYVDAGMSDDARVHLRYASDALCQQQASLRKLGLEKPEVLSETSEAEILLQLADVDGESEARNDLRRARLLASTAEERLGSEDKGERSHTENILGNVALAEGDLPEAVQHFRTSTDLKEHPVGLKNLAHAEMRLALDSSDNSILADATQDYARAAKVCEQEDRALCFIVHSSACDGGLKVAERIGPDVVSKRKWLDYAIEQCEAARQYESVEQERDVLNLSFMQVVLAAESPGRRQTVAELYAEPIKDLTRVIDALRASNPTALPDLLLRRATLYRDSGAAFSQLALADQAEARKIAQHKHKQTSASDHYRPVWAASLACAQSKVAGQSAPRH